MKWGGFLDKVYYRKNLATQESVAVKVMKKDEVKERGLMEQIEREISVMLFIVELKQVMATKTKILCVMEYAKGGELFAKTPSLKEALLEGNWRRRTSKSFSWTRCVVVSNRSIGILQVLQSYRPVASLKPQSVHGSKNVKNIIGCTSLPRVQLPIGLDIHNLFNLSDISNGSSTASLTPFSSFPITIFSHPLYYLSKHSNIPTFLPFLLIFSANINFSSNPLDLKKKT